MSKEQFYKIALPDGWDFFTGNTINYRNNIGKLVRCPTKGKAKLCTSTVIHASRDPNQCFIGGSIPCSLYLVEGNPIVEDKQKGGFKQLRVLRELDPAKVFQWRYEEACSPVRPFDIKPPKQITEQHLVLLKTWASVWDSVWDSVGDSVGDSVRAYIGYIFEPVVTTWKYIDHQVGEYPFQPAVDLWKMGLVPSFDGKVWRLHGGKDAKILWEGQKP